MNSKSKKSPKVHQDIDTFRHNEESRAALMAEQNRQLKLVNNFNKSSFIRKAIIEACHAEK